MLNTHVFCVLGMAVSEDDPDEPLEWVSVLALLEALLEQLGAFISPYLPRLLKTVFCSKAAFLALFC